jgi:metal-responsive CopG/Arc/MetJ family transcriptional regulator
MAKVHTYGIKVAVSIPDPIFAEAEGLAKRLKLSRSRLYAQALDEFVANHAAGTVTEAMNLALDAIAPRPDAFALEAARRTFAQTEW